jgi:hypothetical protein
LYYRLLSNFLLKLAFDLKKNYSNLKDFRLEFQNEAFTSDKPRLLLTAAVAVWKPKVEAGYEPGKISQ